MPRFPARSASPASKGTQPPIASHCAASIGVGIVSVIAALSGISTVACLVLLAFAPAVTILVYELRGYRAATLAN